MKNFYNFINENQKEKPKMPTAEILEGLYLGDKRAANSADFIKKRKIKAILNCTPYPNPSKTLGKMEVLIPIHDNSQKQNNDFMYGFFPAAVKYIENHLIKQKQNVLVHCAAGIQRSATIVVAFLMYYFKISAKEAIKITLELKPDIFYEGTEIHFWRALKKWEKDVLLQT